MEYDIVVGVDTSPASRRAVALACQLNATELMDGVLLVHVIPWSQFSFTTPQENEQRHAEREHEIEAAKAQVLEPMRRVALEHGVDPGTETRHGERVHVLEEIAREHRARLLVVGRTGDTGLRERIFGGLPSHLVQSSEVPVVVVP